MKKKKTIRYGAETYGTVTHKAAQWWELWPYDTKNSLTLIEFKDKTYLKNIGYETMKIKLKIIVVLMSWRKYSMT